jgi:hypothetical protein
MINALMIKDHLTEDLIPQATWHIKLTTHMAIHRHGQMMTNDN